MKTQNRNVYTLGRLTCATSLMVGGLVSCTKPYRGLSEADKRQIEWEVAQEMRAEEAEMRARYNNPNTPAWERDGYRTNPELTRQWKSYVDENNIEVVEDEDANSNYQTAEYSDSNSTEDAIQAESSDTTTTANTESWGSWLWDNGPKIVIGTVGAVVACSATGLCGGSSDSSSQVSAPPASSGGWFGGNNDVYIPLPKDEVAEEVAARQQKEEAEKNARIQQERDEAAKIYVPQIREDIYGSTE